MDKAALITGARLKHDTMEIEGVGTITVRELSRWEMIHVFRLESNRHEQEQAALAYGMVDPEMTAADIKAWQLVAGNDEIERVARKINELSGIGKGAAKSNLPSDGPGSDAGV